MKVSIQDKEALLAISPAALSAYARTAGWAKVDTYGEHSDVFTGEGLPEIILPRTAHLGDYARVVSMVIEIFAKVADMDELTLYRDLVMADRDVVRVRAVDGDASGSVAVNDGIDLISGARDMILAAACSLQGPQPLYRAEATREARAYLSRVRLGQTEQGSFAVTLLSPVISPLERRVTRRLADALAATREATEKTIDGDAGAFSAAVALGVSANLCEALVKLIRPFPTLDISLVWARTHPMSTARNVVRFASHDAPILHKAARSFREREPRPDIFLPVARDSPGQYEAAIAGFEVPLLNFADPEAYYKRGIARNFLGQYEAAIADFDAALRLNPDYAEAYCNRGVARNFLGQYDAAIADFDAALGVKSDYAEAYYNRGVAMDSLGQHEAAIADFDAALRLKPDFAKAYYNRGLAELQLNRIDEARQNFERVLNLAQAMGNEGLMGQARVRLENLDRGDAP